MAHPRFHNLDPQRQQQIIEAAGQEFARSGYKSASLNAIIEAAGFSKGAFYYYFDSKEDLLATVLRHVSDVIFQGRAPDFSALTRDTFWPTLKHMSERTYDFGRDHGWITTLSKVLQQEQDSLGPLTQGFLDEMTHVLRSFLCQGQALGLIRDDLPLDLLMAISHALDQAVDRWIASHWTSLPPDQMLRVIDALFEMTKRMLSPPTPEGAP